jgi:hypothetical protein
MQLPTTLPARETRLTNPTLPLPHTPRRRRTMRPRPTLLDPIIPAPRVLAHVRVPCLSRDASSSLAADPRFAEENHLLANGGLREAELVLELGGREEQGVGRRGYGQVNGGGDAVCAKLVGLADVD